MFKAEVASRPDLLGNSVFGNDEICSRLCDFLHKWRAAGIHGAGGTPGPPGSTLQVSRCCGMLRGGVDQSLVWRLFCLGHARFAGKTDFVDLVRERENMIIVLVGAMGAPTRSNVV